MQHKGTQTLTTQRLILRGFCPEDAEPMFRNWASDEQVTRYLTWPTYKNVETAHLVTDYWVKGYEKPDFYQWAIVPQELGEPIGSIAAVHIDENTGAVTIGYCIGRPWWGKGIMPEALQAAVAFFFDEVGAGSVRASHDPRNPNSGRVMQKCAMQYEGTFRQTGVNNQGVCDECWYSILREEYETAKTK